MSRGLALLVPVLLATGAAQAKEKTTVAVLDLKSSGTDESVAQNLTQVVAASLADLGVFTVLSRADIQQMLQFESEKQALGCESDTACLAEIGGALGVALVVTGSVGQVGDSFILNLALTDTQAGRVLAREQRNLASLSQVTAETPGAARFLVRELLEGHQGDLILRASESEAEVEIDGKLVAVTPLGPQTLAGGPHRLRVSKKGFITWTRDVEIRAAEPTLVEVSLAPSAEFIAEYEATALRWRLGAYLTGGAGLAALAFAGYGYFIYNTNRTSALNAEIEAAGCVEGSIGQPTTDCQRSFAARRDSIRTWDNAAAAAFVGGVLALGTATYLFAAGPDPSRYEDFRARTSVGVALVPTTHGLYGSATLRF